MSLLPVLKQVCMKGPTHLLFTLYAIFRAKSLQLVNDSIRCHVRKQKRPAVTFLPANVIRLQFRAASTSGAVAHENIKALLLSHMHLLENSFLY
jgi:hypothetical protein